MLHYQMKNYDSWVPHGNKAHLAQAKSGLSLEIVQVGGDNLKHNITYSVLYTWILFV